MSEEKTQHHAEATDPETQRLLAAVAPQATQEEATEFYQRMLAGRDLLEQNGLKYILLAWDPNLDIGNTVMWGAKREDALILIKRLCVVFRLDPQALAKMLEDVTAPDKWAS